MDRSFIFKALLSSFLLLVLFPSVQAHTLIEEETVVSYHSKSNPTSLTIANEYLQQGGKQKGKKKSGNNQRPNQPNIKTVPKAHKQPRPTVITKPKSKSKPTKGARPETRKR